MSQNPLLEVELYAFASNSAQFYLTPHEFDVDLDGNLYASLSIERNELALGAEAAKSALELKLPPDCDLVRHLLANSLTGETTSVTLRIGRRDTWATTGGCPARAGWAGCWASRSLTMSLAFAASRRKSVSNVSDCGGSTAASAPTFCIPRPAGLRR